MRLELGSEWAAKTVTTDPPRYVPHEEWRLSVKVASESPVRVVHVLSRELKISWGLSAKSPAARLVLGVDFFPSDWKSSDWVQINSGWRHLSVTDRDLKEDPRTNVAVTLPDCAETGVLVPVCEVPAHGIEVAVLFLSTEDTERRRNDRWRVRPDLASRLPNGLEGLASGRQSGMSRLSA